MAELLAKWLNNEINLSKVSAQEIKPTQIVLNGIVGVLVRKF